MKTQNTSATVRRQPLLGAQIHESQRTSLSTNVDANGKTRRLLQTSKLELNWCHGELLIRFTGSAVALVKAGA